MIDANGSTPPETPAAKTRRIMAKLYDVPDGATPEEERRITRAALRATDGRLAVIETYVVEFSRKLDGFKLRERSWWVWPLIAGAAVTFAYLK